MKKKQIIALVMVGLGLGACAVRKPILAYEFPPEMKENVKQEYIKMWDKGRVLYDIECAQCHNKIANRRVVIPDFTPEQLKGYELRVLNKEHESHMPDERVTAEELVLISMFLLYKAKN